MCGRFALYGNPKRGDPKGTAEEESAFLEPQAVPLQVHQAGLAVDNPRNQGEQLVAPLNPA